MRLHLGLKGGPPIDGTEVRAQMVRLRQGEALSSIADELLATGPWASESDDDLITRGYFTLVQRLATSAERSAARTQITNQGRGVWLAGLAQTGEATRRMEDRVQLR